MWTTQAASLAAESAMHVYGVAVLTAIFEGAEGARDGDLTHVHDEIDRERSATLALAVVAVADSRGEEVVEDLVGDLAKEASPGPCHWGKRSTDLRRVPAAEAALRLQPSDDSMTSRSKGPSNISTNVQSCSWVGSWSIDVAPGKCAYPPGPSC